MNRLLALTLIAPMVCLVGSEASAQQDTTDAIDAPISMAVLVQKDVSPRMAKAVKTRVTANERVAPRDGDAFRASLTAQGIDTETLLQADPVTVSGIMRKQQVEAVMLFARKEGGTYQVVTIGPEGTKAGDLSAKLTVDSQDFERELDDILLATILLTRPQVVVHRKRLATLAVTGPMPTQPAPEVEPTVASKPAPTPSVSPAASSPAPEANAERESLLQNRPYPPRLKHMTFAVMFEGMFDPVFAEKDTAELELLPLGGSISADGIFARKGRWEYRWDGSARLSYARARLDPASDSAIPEQNIFGRHLDGAASAITRVKPLVSLGGRVGFDRTKQFFGDGFGELAVTNLRLAPTMRIQGARVSLEGEVGGRFGFATLDNTAPIIGADARGRLKLLVGRFGILTFGGRRAIERSSGLESTTLLPDDGVYIQRTTELHAGFGFSL